MTDRKPRTAAEMLSFSYADVLAEHEADIAELREARVTEPSDDGKIRATDDGRKAYLLGYAKGLAAESPRAPGSTAASEPSEGPCSLPEPCPLHPRIAPQPSAEADVIGWYDILNTADEAGYTRTEAQARAVAAEVAQRESGLRAENGRLSVQLDIANRADAHARAQTVAASDRIAQLERELAEERVELASVRRSLDTANDSNAKLFKRLDAAEDPERERLIAAWLVSYDAHGSNTLSGDALAAHEKRRKEGK